MLGTPPEAAGRSPDLVDVAIVSVAVVGLSVAGHGIGTPIYVLPVIVVLSAISVVVAGLPALAFALDIGRGRLLMMVLSGVVAGLVPPLALAASGGIRMLATFGWRRFADGLADGVFAPAYGLIEWSTFGGLTLETCAIGALSGLMVWSAAQARDAGRRRQP